MEEKIKRKLIKASEQLGKISQDIQVAVRHVNNEELRRLSIELERHELEFDSWVNNNIYDNE